MASDDKREDVHSYLTLAYRWLTDWRPSVCCRCRFSLSATEFSWIAMSFKLPWDALARLCSRIGRPYWYSYYFDVCQVIVGPRKITSSDLAYYLTFSILSRAHLHMLWMLDFTSSLSIYFFGHCGYVYPMCSLILWKKYFLNKSCLDGIKWLRLTWFPFG